MNPFENIILSKFNHISSLEHYSVVSSKHKTTKKKNWNRLKQAISLGGLEEAWRRLEEDGGGFSATQLVNPFPDKIAGRYAGE